MPGWDDVVPGNVHTFAFSDHRHTECGLVIDHMTWGKPTVMIPLTLVCGQCGVQHPEIAAAFRAAH